MRDPLAEENVELRGDGGSRVPRRHRRSGLRRSGGKADELRLIRPAGVRRGRDR